MTGNEFDYDYLKTKSDDELVKIIKEMADYEEVSEAYLILDEHNQELAFQLGKDIYTNNRGDDYLQATIWDVMYLADSKKSVEVLAERNEKLGKVLFEDIVNSLTFFDDEIGESEINLLKESYYSFTDDIQNQYKIKFNELLNGAKNNKNQI